MRFRYLFLLALLTLTVSPCQSLLTTDPVEDFEWCGFQDISLWGENSTIPGYRMMDHVPQRANQTAVTSPSISSASGEITLGTWISMPFNETKVIAPGRWIFRTYAIASSDAGNTRMHYRLFNRTSSGNITWLFFGQAISQDITQNIHPFEYNTFYARRNYTYLNSGDRLGIQINVSTDSAAARTVKIEVGGNSNASYVSSAYYLCTPSAFYSTSSGSDGGAAIGMIFGIVGGLVGAVLIFGRQKQ